MIIINIIIIVIIIRLVLMLTSINHNHHFAINNIMDNVSKFLHFAMINFYIKCHQL